MRRPRHEQLGADRSACPFDIARTTHSRSDQKDPHRLVALLNERFKKSGGFSVEPAGPGPVHYRFRCRKRQMVQLILPADEGKGISGDGRSEERRVGKECGSTCRSRWSTDRLKQKTQYSKNKNDKYYT